MVFNYFWKLDIKCILGDVKFLAILVQILAWEGGLIFTPPPPPINLTYTKKPGKNRVNWLLLNENIGLNQYVNLLNLDSSTDYLFRNVKINITINFLI